MPFRVSVTAETLMNQLFHWLVLVPLSLGLVAGCASGPFITATLYDSPAKYVRLQLDRTVKKGAEHSHPTALSPEQMAAVLAGVRVIEPVAFVRGDIMEVVGGELPPPVHPAFTDKEVSFFAPLLALALSKATPEEVVTFYETRYISAITREVTSGGLFIQGDELHLILANYRSHTHYMADLGVAETQDDRLTPMKSMAPQEGRLDFEPSSAKRERPVGFWDKLFQWDRREVVVSFRQLSPRHLVRPDSS